MSFDYEDKLPHWVNRLSYALRVEVALRFKAAGHDLTAEEWALLMILWGDEPQTVSLLAQRSLRDRTTVTRFVDGMVAKGLLTREHGKEDRRRVEVGLTAAARALEAPLTALIESLIHEATQGIAVQDIAIATRVLQQMTTRLRS